MLIIMLIATKPLSFDKGKKTETWNLAKVLGT